jgi:soluble lytic murein transglycosylase-like protein
MADFDRFALGLVGALQAADDRQMKQESLDRQDKLLQLQLQNADVDRDYKKALTEKARAEMGSPEALAKFMEQLDAPPQSAQQVPGQSPVPPATIKPTSSLSSPALAQYEPMLQQTAAKTGVPIELLRATVAVESSGDNNAISPKGARGVAQFMPATARQYGVDVTSPESSIDGAGRYLSDLKKQFGNWELASAAYNAGPGNVQKYGGVPPFAETQNHLKKLSAAAPGVFDVAASTNQASDAYPATPAPGRAVAQQPAAPVAAQLESIDSWEAQQRARALSFPGLSSTDRNKAIEAIQRSADRKRNLLQFQYRDEHYKERMDNQERNFRAREEGRGVVNEIRQATQERKDAQAALKAAQDEAKNNSGELARIDDLAKTYSTTTQQVKDDLGKTETKYVADTEMQQSIAPVLRGIIKTHNVPEMYWANVASDAKDAYNAALTMAKAQGATPQQAAAKARDAAHATLQEKWSDKSGDAAAKASAESVKNPGALQGDPEPAVTTDEGEAPGPVSAPAPQAQQTPGDSAPILPTKGIPVPKNVKLQDATQYLEDEARLKEQRGADSRIANSLGIPATDIAKGQAADFARRALGNVDMGRLAQAVSPSAFKNTLIDQPVRAVSTMYDRQFGAEGFKKELSAVMEQYQKATTAQRATLDALSKNRWGVTLGELLRERTAPKYKENE